MNVQKDDPLLLLSKSSYKTVVLKMKATHLNTILMPCCYSEANSCKVYKWIPNDARDITFGQSGKRILKINEKSSCVSRCITPQSYRAHESFFKAENTGRVIFQMNRPLKPTFFCLARPEVRVYISKQGKKRSKSNKNIKSVAYLDSKENTLGDLNQSKKKQGQAQALELDNQPDRALLGRAALPFTFSGKSVVIYDDLDVPLYQIIGSSLQCQTCFLSLPVGPCKQSVFSIVEYRQNLAEPIGRVYKRWSDCFKLCCASAPWYVIDFPAKIDWKRKILIIAGVQLLDQYYFSGYCQ